MPFLLAVNICQFPKKLCRKMKCGSLREGGGGGVGVGGGVSLSKTFTASSFLGSLRISPSNRYLSLDLMLLLLLLFDFTKLLV